MKLLSVLSMIFMMLHGSNAQAGSAKKEALNAFKVFATKQAAFDAAAWDEFAAQGIVKFGKPGESPSEAERFDLAQMRDWWISIRPNLISRSDQTLYTRLKARETDVGVRITGVRTRPTRCETDTKFYAELQKGTSGWKITELYHQESPYSQCPATAMATQYVQKYTTGISQKVSGSEYTIGVRPNRRQPVAKFIYFNDMQLDNNTVISRFMIEGVTPEDTSRLQQFSAQQQQQILQTYCSVPGLRQMMAEHTEFVHQYVSEKSEHLFTLNMRYLVCEQPIEDLTHGLLTLAVPETCSGHYIVAQGAYRIRCEHVQLRMESTTYTLEELKAFAAKFPSSVVGQQTSLTYQGTEWSIMTVKTQRSPCPTSLGVVSFATGVLHQQPFAAQLCTAKPIATADDMERIFGPMEPTQSWTKACDDSDVRACFNLGVIYFNGQGRPKDYQQALQLWTKSCSLGDLESCYALGAVYQSGKEVPKDSARAAEFLNKACDGGYSKACELVR